MLSPLCGCTTVIFSHHDLYGFWFILPLCVCQCLAFMPLPVFGWCAVLLAVWFPFPPACCVWGVVFSSFGFPWVVVCVFVLCCCVFAAFLVTICAPQFVLTLCVHFCCLTCLAHSGAVKKQKPTYCTMH